MSARSGLDAGAVQRLFERAETEVAQGRLPACQVAVACGDWVLVETFGAPPESRFVVFSITKSLVAGAMWALLSDGSLSRTTRVAEVVPEFGANGKDAVTVEHLLTHTAGFPRAPMRPEDGATSAGRCARFAEWRLDWEPGSRMAYHATSAHWVLAEVLERVAGADYRWVIKRTVLQPLGLGTVQLGVPPAEQADIVDVAVVGAPDPGAFGGKALEAALAEAAPDLLLRYNEPEVRLIGVPGAGAVGGAGDIAWYFQALLRNFSGMWDADVLRLGTATVLSEHPDPLTKIPANRTLGLVLAGDDGKGWMRELGRKTGPRAFVSSGIGGQVAWADPDTGLSFCFLTSGIDNDVVASFMRTSELSDLAAACAV